MTHISCPLTSDDKDNIGGPGETEFDADIVFQSRTVFISHAE